MHLGLHAAAQCFRAGMAPWTRCSSAAAVCVLLVHAHTGRPVSSHCPARRTAAEPARPRGPG